jgi:heme A synthase
MRKTYIVLAWIIAGGVFVQAAAIAFGFGGMAGFVQDGGVVDKALVESTTASNFTGELGFPVHGIVGGMVIPLAALLLLVVSFFVKKSRARTWAAVVFGLVIVQAMLGYSIVDVPYLGLLHGANALAVLLTAVQAARCARVAGAVEAAAPSSRVAA